MIYDGSYTLPETNMTSPLIAWMVGRCISFWDCLFSGVMLVSGRVYIPGGLGLGLGISEPLRSTTWIFPSHGQPLQPVEVERWSLGGPIWVRFQIGSIYIYILYIYTYIHIYIYGLFKRDEKTGTFRKVLVDVYFCFEGFFPGW